MKGCYPTTHACPVTHTYLVFWALLGYMYPPLWSIVRTRISYPTTVPVTATVTLKDTLPWLNRAVIVGGGRYITFVTEKDEGTLHHCNSSIVHAEAIKRGSRTRDKQDILLGTIHTLLLAPKSPNHTKNTIWLAFSVMSIENIVLHRNTSILNQDFNSKTPVLCFIISKGEKEVEIYGKDHSFHSSLLILILFSWCQSYNVSRNASLDSR